MSCFGNHADNPSWLRIRRLFVVLCLAASGLIGCGDQMERKIRDMAAQMDVLQRELEEWGTLSISAPLVSSDGSDFKFDLDLKDRELYAANRTEGAVSLRTAQALDVQASFRVEQQLSQMSGRLKLLQSLADPKLQMELLSQIRGDMADLSSSPEGKAALAALTAANPEAGAALSAIASMNEGSVAIEKTLKEKIADQQADATASEQPAAGSSSPSAEAPPPAVAGASPAPARVEAPDFMSGRAAAAVGGLTPMAGLYDGDLTMNQRRRIRLTASDRFELGLHKFLSNPKNRENYDIRFMVFTVNCMPGWRSRQDFVGIVDARLSVQDQCREEIEEESWPPGTLGPFVIGVYPAFDSQELNLRSGYRQLITISGQLAAAGFAAGARVFLEAAQRVEQDAETFTGLAQVTSYASGGRHFGYEFRPAFRALEEPGSRTAKPGYRLESVSLPAVAIMAVPKLPMGKTIDRNRFRQLQRKEASNRGFPSYAEVLTNPKAFQMYEDLAKRYNLTAGEQNPTDLSLDVTHEWRPISAPLAVDIPVIGPASRLLQKRLGASESADAYIRLKRIREDYLNADSSDTIGEWHHVLKALGDRFNSLEVQTRNYSPKVALVGPRKLDHLSIESIEPRRGLHQHDNRFVLRGSGLARLTTDSEGKNKWTAASVRLDDLSTSYSIPPDQVAAVGDESLLVSLPKMFIDAIKLKPKRPMYFIVSDDLKRVARSDHFVLLPTESPAETIEVKVKRENGKITGVEAPRGPDDATKRAIDELDFKRILEVLKSLEECCVPACYPGCPHRRHPPHATSSQPGNGG